MKIVTEISLENFEAWSGAVRTLDRIRDAGLCDTLEAILDDQYPDGMTETELNDLLWFEPETVFEWLGMRTESEVQEELEEAKEELEELEQRYADACDELEEECSEEDYDSLTFEERKDRLWYDDYADDAEELRERIAELEEELDSL